MGDLTVGEDGCAHRGRLGLACSVRTVTRGPISVPAYFVLGALTMITPLSTNIFAPSLPRIAAAFGATPAAAQLAVSSALIGIALGQLVIGSISDRLGRRLPVLVGTLVFVILCLACAAAPSLPVLIALRFLQGFAGASGVVLARASIRDRTSGPYAAQALSRLLIVAAIAPVVGPLLGALAQGFIDWHGVFLVLAAMGAIAFTLSLKWFPETLRRGGHAGESSGEVAVARRRLLRDPMFWCYVLVAGLLGMLSFSWLGTSSFLLQTQYGASTALYSVILGLTSLAFLVSAAINSRMVMRIGARKALLRGLVLIALGCTALLVSILTHAPLVVLVATALVGFGAYGGMIANAQALGMDAHGDAAGTAAAILGSAQFLLGAFIPPIVTHFFGATWSMGATMLVAALLALLLTVVAGRRGHDPHDIPAEVVA